jgi:hypothetical protein
MDEDQDEDKFTREDENESAQEDEEVEELAMDVELNHDDTLLLEEIKEEHHKKEVPWEEEYIAADEVETPTCLTFLDVESDTELGNHTRRQIAAYTGLAPSMSF